MKSYTDAWGWWFTGFVDGEGSFAIAQGHRNKNALFIPRFHIALRADDELVVRECNKRFPGSLTYAEPSEKIKSDPERSNTHPQWRWTVGKKKSLSALCVHFEKYPLQSKKAESCEFWQWTVREYLKPPKQRNNVLMAEMRKALMANHDYESAPHDLILGKIISPQFPMELD